ncbi:MAG: tRNA lysidine(34) synthetase TilS [Oceanicaulis sp.]
MQLGRAPTLAVGLSGGGDSTALLLALRRAAPDLKLAALIVDHGLRPESASEAGRAAGFARSIGAEARVLRWDAPRPGQNAARTARHLMLARACAEIGAPVLCLGHTLEDRVETLRMRAARPGSALRLAGPSGLDPSPVWPQGRGLLIARPFLSLRRKTLRAFLRAEGVDWIEDPSNADPAYERVRLRRAPIDPAAEAALLTFSDAAQAVRAAEGRAAFALLGEAMRLCDLGIAALDRAGFAAAPRRVAIRAIEAVAAGVSGEADGPGPHAEVLLDALLAGRAASAAGVLLTASGRLGRDPGAAAGRADGAGGAEPLILPDNGAGVFDGRFEIGGPARIEALGGRACPPEFADAPAVFRPGLPVEASGGEALAPQPMRLLARDRIAARLLSPASPAWFDALSDAARGVAALAKAPARPNIRA